MKNEELIKLSNFLPPELFQSKRLESGIILSNVSIRKFLVLNILVIIHKF